MKYEPIKSKKNLIIGSGSNLAVVTGWTKPELIQKKLNSDNYAVIGSLYSSYLGINFLLRNLIANPEIEKIIAFKLTKEDQCSKTIDCLEHFFNKGFEIDEKERSKTINIISYLDTKIPLDSEIPTMFLESVRNTVSIEVFTDLKKGVEAIKKNSLNKEVASGFQVKHNGINLRRKGLIFPDDNFSEEKKTLPLNSITLRGDRLKTIWLEAMDKILHGGRDSLSRYDFRLKKIFNLISIIKHNQEEILRKDWLTSLYFNQLPFPQEFLENYVEEFIEKDGKKKIPKKGNLGYISYTYPDRIYRDLGANQVNKCVENLSKNPCSSTIINLWDSEKDPDSSSPPCLNQIWLKIEDNALFMTAVFRSHDIYSAWFINTVALIALQRKIVKQLNISDLKIGDTTIISEDAHLYDYNFPQAEKLLQEEFNKKWNKSQDFQDPSGCFIIETLQDDKEATYITVKHQHENKITFTAEGKNVTKIYNFILEKVPFLNRSHCCYLGKELEKAKMAIALGINYVQDRPLDTKSLKSS